MISRLSTFATAFAVVVTTALALTAEAQQRPVWPVAAIVPTKTVRIVELPRVLVVAHRLQRDAH